MAKLVVSAIIVCLAIFVLSVRLNLATGDEHESAVRINKNFNRLLRENAQSIRCSELESRYEASRGRVILNVHGWVDSCNTSVVEALGAESVKSAYSTDGEPQITINFVRDK